VRQGLALLSHELSRHHSRPNASFTYHMASLAAYMKHRAWCAALCWGRGDIKSIGDDDVQQ
jgi:hypothetical protein